MGISDQDTESAQNSQIRDGRNISVIIKTMFPPAYQHNGFVATHALGHMVCIYIYGMAFTTKEFSAQTC